MKRFTSFTLLKEEVKKVKNRIEDIKQWNLSDYIENRKMIENAVDKIVNRINAK